MAALHEPGGPWKGLMPNPMPKPLDLLLPDWLPPSVALPIDPEDAFFKALSTALDPNSARHSRAAGLSDYVPFEIPLAEDRVKSVKYPEEDYIWQRAGERAPSKPTLLTWDTSDQVRGPSTLLSHRPDLFYPALRRVLPTPSTLPLPVALVAAEMRTTMLGYSGSLWIWDAGKELFEASPTFPDDMMIEGYTLRASISIIRRFLNMGTLLRRLEAMPNVIRYSSHPWYHAFSHALSLILSHIRSELESPSACPKEHFISLHLGYGDSEHLLVALAELLDRDMSTVPPYRPLPAALLSHIHAKLSKCIATSGPHVIQCGLAFLLQAASTPSLRAIEESLGLGAPPVWQPFNELKGETDVDEEPSLLEIAIIEGLLPSDVSQALERGRRSLVLLERACPQHPLCRRMSDGKSRVSITSWIWTEAEIERIQAEAEEHADTLRSAVNAWRLGIEPLQASSLPPAIIEPLPSLRQTSLDDLVIDGLQLLGLDSTVNEFSDFVVRHPAPLMPITAPSMPLLIRAVFSKLVARSKVLGQALLDILISSKESERGADLISHLSILKSFHLLCLPAFTNLLANALFVHPSPELAHAPGTRSRVRARLGLGSKIRDDGEYAAVGLGVGLTQRGRWPPGGADLGWILRRVVMDALSESATEDRQDSQTWSEAEWRVGFAIQDLGEGDDAWLDPLALEALDFLDLVYKPPPSLTVLLTKVVLKKYSRIFNFLLRLLRVDTVVRTILVPELRQRLFPSSNWHTALLHRFRFQAQAFVSSLVAYVYDTALKRTWAPFIRELERLQSFSAVGSGMAGEATSHDVFSISSDHNRILDGILENCMLRSAQQKIAVHLRGCMHGVLLLGQLVLDRRRDTVSEQEGEGKLVAFSTQFRLNIRALIEALKQYNGDVSPPTNLRMSDRRLNSGVGLSDLLLRLTVHTWYEKTFASHDERPGVP